MKLKAPQGVSSITLEGEVFEVKKGVCDVPDQYVDAAMSHGFTHIVAKSKAADVEQEDDTAETAEAAETAETPAGDDAAGDETKPE